MMDGLSSCPPDICNTQRATWKCWPTFVDTPMNNQSKICASLLVLVGCTHNSLPPEDYGIVVTETKSSAPPDAGVVVPPIHTWMTQDDINKLERENLDKMLESSFRCDCQKGDPLCPCIAPKPEQ